MSLTQIHGAAVLVWMPVVGNFLLAAWAGAAWLRGRRVLPPLFWAVLLLVLAPLAVQAAAGLVLVLSGDRPRTGLHLLYAGLVVVTGLAQYGLRPGGSVRRAVTPASALAEAQILALLCLTQAGLLMRAWMTGLFGR